MSGRRPNKKKDWLDSLDAGPAETTAKPTPETKQVQKPARKPAEKPEARPTRPPPAPARTDDGIAKLATAIEKNSEAMLGIARSGEKRDAAIADAIRAIASARTAGQAPGDSPTVPSLDAIRRRIVTLAWQDGSSAIAYDVYNGLGANNMIKWTFSAVNDVLANPNRVETMYDDMEAEFDEIQQRRSSKRKTNRKTPKKASSSKKAGKP